MKKYQFYDLRKSVSSLLILRIITTAHILTSVPLIQWNIILYGVHSLVQAAARAASPSKVGDFGPLSLCARYESNQ